MPLIGFTPENIGKMTDIERAIEEALKRVARDDGKPAEAAIIVFALTRLTRKLLLRYPDAVQGDLLDAIIPFLRRDQVKGDAGRLITLN